MKSVSIKTTILTGRFCLGVAACLSLYLACVGLGRKPLLGCEAGSACAKALETPWAFVFGLPVSFPAFLVYGIALLRSGPSLRRERSWAAIQGTAALGAVVTAAIWFSCLQIAAVSFLCLWCSLIHGFAAAGAGCLCLARAKYAPSPDDRGTEVPDARGRERHLLMGRIAVSGVAVVCMGVLAASALSGRREVAAATGVSVAVEARVAVAAEMGGTETVAPAATETGLAVYGGKYHVNPDEFPVIGGEAADAPAAVLLCDYKSERSRQYLAAVQSFLQVCTKPARVIVLPVAFTPENADIQRTVLTLHLTDRGAWRSLSALITSGQIPAEAKAVERAARKLAGEKKWEEALHAGDDKIAPLVQLAASLLEESRRDGSSAAAPVLLHASRALTPSSPDMEEFMAFLKSEDAAAAAPAKALPVAGTETFPPAAAARGKNGAGLSAAAPVSSIPPEALTPFDQP